MDYWSLDLEILLIVLYSYAGREATRQGRPNRATRGRPTLWATVRRSYGASSSRELARHARWWCQGLSMAQAGGYLARVLT